MWRKVLIVAGLLTLCWADLAVADPLDEIKDEGRTRGRDEGRLQASRLSR